MKFTSMFQQVVENSGAESARGWLPNGEVVTVWCAIETYTDSDTSWYLRSAGETYNDDVSSSLATFLTDMTVSRELGSSPKFVTDVDFNAVWSLIRDSSLEIAAIENGRQVTGRAIFIIEGDTEEFLERGTIAVGCNDADILAITEMLLTENQLDTLGIDGSEVRSSIGGVAVEDSSIGENWILRAKSGWSTSGGFMMVVEHNVGGRYRWDVASQGDVDPAQVLFAAVRRQRELKTYRMSLWLENAEVDDEMTRDIDEPSEVDELDAALTSSGLGQVKSIRGARRIYVMDGAIDSDTKSVHRFALANKDESFEPPIFDMMEELGILKMIIGAIEADSWTRL
ncbi:MAG: hypothetical protein ACTII7_11920 [Galactobacter sp.]